MEYRATKVIANNIKREEIVTALDARLAEWAQAGWTLHSQSYTYAHPCELVVLIFQRANVDTAQ